MPRRRPGALLPLELDILRTALHLRSTGSASFHGFGLARTLGEGADGRLLAHGTLYKALGRLEDMGMLASRWEDDPPVGRPRRRQYRLTSAGARAATAGVTTGAAESSTSLGPAATVEPGRFAPGSA